MVCGCSDSTKRLNCCGSTLWSVSAPCLPVAGKCWAICCAATGPKALTSSRLATSAPPRATLCDIGLGKFFQHRLGLIGVHLRQAGDGLAHGLHFFVIQAREHFAAQFFSQGDEQDGGLVPAGKLAGRALDEIHSVFLGWLAASRQAGSMPCLIGNFTAMRLSRRFSTACAFRLSWVCTLALSRKRRQAIPIQGNKDCPRKRRCRTYTSSWNRSGSRRILRPLVNGTAPAATSCASSTKRWRATLA